MENSVLFFLAALMVVAGVLWIQSLLIRRAISKVIRIFCQYRALGIGNSKTAEELGLTSPGLFHRLTRPKDYKPIALQLLMQAGIVKMTENGRLYMAEEKLGENMRCRVIWQPI